MVQLAPNTLLLEGCREFLVPNSDLSPAGSPSRGISRAWALTQHACRMHAGPIPGPRLPETAALCYLKLRGRGFYPLVAFGEHTNTPFGYRQVTSGVIGPRPLVAKTVRSLDFCSTILAVCDSVS